MDDLESFDHVRDTIEKFLHDADLLKLSFGEKDEIYLSFIIGGTEDVTNWLDVRCSGIHVFNIAKDPTEPFVEGFWVGGGRLAKFNDEQNVRAVLESSGWKFHESLPQTVYRFEVEGAVEIKIICTEFFLSKRQEG